MRKKPIQFHNTKGLLEVNQTVVIGIIGTHRGAGVTHTAIMLANYLSETFKRKTAILECNNHRDFSYIQMEYEGLTHRVLGVPKFQINEVVYYKEVKDYEIANILSERYHYVILDLGTDMNENGNEFLRCNIKLVVSSLIEWKRPEFLSFLQNISHIPAKQSFEYLILFGHKEEMLEIKRKYHVSIHGIPYEPDPYLLSKESLKLLEKFK